VASSGTAYLDASAFVKLVVSEPETDALRAYLGSVKRKVTSQIAIVEVTRAARLADPTPETLGEAERLLAESELIGFDRQLLDRAAQLASSRLRTLDAIHLATALAVEPDELVAYDRRLLAAAKRQGLAVASPGASS
jgi:predicted nucleic acid-binding protein